MLLTTESNNGSSSLMKHQSSILNTPTLARVERARIRNETNQMHREDSLVKHILDPKHSILTKKLPINCITGPIKRGLLWQQRDRLFSRWKERYFVLTLDYLHCFKRASASERISDMGQFIFKVKLFDVEKVEWLNRRSYSAISLCLGNRESRILLRSERCLEDWFELLEECILNSKQRRQALRNIQGLRSRASIAAPPTHSSLQRNIGNGMGYSSAIEDSLLPSRFKSSNTMVQFLLSDSVPDLTEVNEFNSLIQNYPSIQQQLQQRRKNNDLISLNSNGNSCNRTNRIISHVNNNKEDNENDADNDDDDDDDDEDDENKVQLRNVVTYENGNGKQWLYRKPHNPSTPRNSSGTYDNNRLCSPSIILEQRPTSYGEVLYTNVPSSTKLTDYSLRNNTLNSHDHAYRPNAHSLRYKLQQKIRQGGGCGGVAKEENLKHSLRTTTNIHESNVSNQNRYASTNENINNGNRIINGESMATARENYRQRPPVFVAVINNLHGDKFRERAFSDTQRVVQRRQLINNNLSNTKRGPLIETPT